eukprot:1379857-Prymnesium_polylepis.1
MIVDYTEGEQRRTSLREYRFLVLHDGYAVCGGRVVSQRCRFRTSFVSAAPPSAAHGGFCIGARVLERKTSQCQDKNSERTPSHGRAGSQLPRVRYHEKIRPGVWYVPHIHPPPFAIATAHARSLAHRATQKSRCTPNDPPSQRWASPPSSETSTT